MHKLLAALPLLASLAVAAADTASYQFAAQWGKLGAAAGQFDCPQGVAVGKAGQVYVVDRNNHRVQTFDANGKFLLSFGKLGVENETAGFGAQGKWEGLFKFPWGVAVDGDGDVYVTDWRNGRVEKFDADGKYLAQWGGLGVDHGELKYPTGICAEGGEVFVANNGAEIYVYDQHGKFLRKITRYALCPQSLCGGGGDLFVGSSQSRFWKLSAKGDLLGWVGQGHLVEDKSQLKTGWFDAAETFSLETGKGRFCQAGDGPGQFANGLNGVAYDRENGRVVVADSRNDRVQVFSKDGEFLCSFGKTGTAPGEFRFPCGVAVDAKGDIYVADKYNHRVQKFACISRKNI